MKTNRGTTPFPNLLLDVFMPRLKDTEWRILCVIVRSTLGWKAADGARKTQDWLSHQQLKKRTGRASTAVSEAIQGLIERGLIAVRDGKGQTVHVPTARMYSRSRLYFSLSSGVDSLIHSLLQSETQKAVATKETHTKENLLYGRPRRNTKARTYGGWKLARDVYFPPSTEKGSDVE